MQMHNQLKTIDTAVILAGGRGTRLSEQTKEIPKPLIDVGGKPIVIHIMRRLGVHGVKNFYILGGYLVNKLYSYFIEHSTISTLSIGSSGMSNIKINDEVLKDCNIQILDTGESTQTAERIAKVKNIIQSNFILTYGDTYSDLDVTNVENRLLEKNNILSLCAVPYFDRFGLVKITDNKSVSEFKEKSESKEYFINGGFLCATPEIFTIIKDSHKDFSKDTMECKDLKGKIGAYIYKGYWKAVDTQRDWEEINKDYNTKNVFI